MDKKSGDEHIFETVGKCRVTVRHGHVVEVCEPRIKGCPLAKRFEIPVDEISTEAVKKSIEQRIRSFGLCTARRKIMSDQDFFGFAPAELLACDLRSGIIDAVVFACEGAGTVIFALTSRGKELVMKRILETNEKIFFKPIRHPVICTNQPEPLV
jgi:hypothetical protein